MGAAINYLVAMLLCSLATAFFPWGSENSYLFGAIVVTGYSIIKEQDK